MTNLDSLLHEFATAHHFLNKGALCVALVVTRHAMERGLPLEVNALTTKNKGQVRNLGKAAVQSILASHGLIRTLAQEGGRTSRGSLGNMEAYVAFLNSLHAQHSSIDLHAVELFWIARVEEYFQGKPFRLQLDTSSSIRHMMRTLLEQARQRQKQSKGIMYLGTLMQHLVGAKLQLVLGDGVVIHRGSNVNDQGEGSTSDYDIGDASIHVSTAPGESLIHKCQENLLAGRTPVLITTSKGVALAEGLAENAGIAHRLDVIEFEQFMSGNLHERSRFLTSNHRMCVEDLVTCYNTIVATHETDPSLRIEIAQGR